MSANEEGPRCDALWLTQPTRNRSGASLNLIKAHIVSLSK